MEAIYMEFGQMEGFNFTVWIEYSVDSLPYDTLGSGSYAAMSVLEHRYRPDMEENEAIELAADAINAGIFNDLGSGGCPNVRIIRKNGTSDFLYEYRRQNKVEDFRRQYARPATLNLPPGITSRKRRRRKVSCSGDFGEGDDGGERLKRWVCLFE